MEIKFISYVPAIMGLLAIGAFVLLNARNISNKIFALLTLTVALWLGCLFGADVTDSAVFALWLLRFALFFGALAFLLFYLFSLVFPYKTRTTVRRQLIYTLPLTIVTFLSFAPMVIPSVSVEQFGAQPQDIGLAYSLSDIVGIFYLLAGITIMILKHRKSDIKQKNQIKFVLIGLSIAIIVNIVTGDILTLLNTGTNYIDAGGFSLFIFALFVAYAMIKHGFLDIRLIVARTVAYTLTLTTLAAIYSAVIFGGLAQILDLSRITRTEQILYLIVAVFLAFTFQPIKKFFDKLTNKLFFRDAYDTQAFLAEFNKTLVTTYELDQLLRESVRIITQNIKPTSCIFVINKTARLEGRIAGAQNRLNIAEGDIEVVRSAVDETKQKLIVTDALESNHLKLQKQLRAKDIVVTAALSDNPSKPKSEVGYLLLGPKKGGNLYSSQDLKVVEIVANELVIAVQNALRFEEIKNFNLTLQGRIDEATKKLRRANEKLREMDETKDDFISMASHQLRTPLTSVKGYISMVLEGDGGKINHKQRDMLGQAFFSSQRMVYLIADLLNVSRLKTGKFIIEATPVNLAQIVKEEMEQLEETAASHSLKLTYDKPKSFPDLMLDETKIRQVIMNFIDNAIYYTPGGGQITVHLLDRKDTVELRVEDDGIGVPKSEQPHLFTKFYRAGNARKQRPDGTGLGLFMAKKVVVAQGGSIIFESQEGKGSTFGFIFSKNKLSAEKHKQ